MKRIRKWLILSAICVFFCACGAEEGVKKDYSELENKLQNLATKDWKKLEGYVDKEKSIRNSNLLNFGYFTYDEKGNIYYVDSNSGGVYTSEFDGKNKRLLCEDSGDCLQFEDMWLYFRSLEGGIKRYNIEDGKQELVYEFPCGEFIINDEKLYINTEKGIYVAELDGSNGKLMNSGLELTGFSINENGMVSNSINGVDAEWFWKGYLIGFEETEESFFLINQRGVYPLFAGNMLSVYDINSATRHVWNLETKKDIDMNIYAQRVVSDGNAIYYFENEESKYTLLKWTEKDVQKLFSVDAHYIECFYLTENRVYWRAKVEKNNEIIDELWYHNLETGNTGQIY